MTKLRPLLSASSQHNSVIIFVRYTYIYIYINLQHTTCKPAVLENNKIDINVLLHITCSG